MAPHQERATSIQTRFEQIAVEHAQDVAISSNLGQLTYSDLKAASDRLAWRLVALRTSRRAPVAVMLPRSTELIVTLLAIIKSGAPYLALDPAQPPMRALSIMKDAQAQLLVTQGDAEALFGDSVEILNDPLAEFEGSLPDSPPEGAPQDLAYVAYTSGSTGQPKGVCVPHDAVLRLVVDTDFIDIHANDTFLQFAPIAFDASTLEIWGPLLNGAKLVIAPANTLTSTEIAAEADREGVTILWLTAGIFHQLDEPSFLRLARLRYLIAGGDVLSPQHVDRAVALLPSTIIVNGYGPTENTTFTCTHQIHARLAGGTVPIGRSITGTHIAVFDGELAPAATGEVGELYIGGRGLAHGYLGNARFTASSFVADPRPSHAGERLYRSGDRVRLGDSGLIEFVGRVDGQRKIRGYRVEPGEVEVAIAAHPDVEDQAVIARRSMDGQTKLIAFYVAQEAIPGSELRRLLAERIPSYMMPASFVRLDRLPLNHNGKVDRASLERYSLPVRPDVGSEFRPAVTMVEHWLVQLWSDLLEVEEIGIDDDFFELGGHSLMAIKITAEIASQYGVHVPVHRFYEAPSPRDVGKLIKEIAMRESVSTVAAE